MNTVYRIAAFGDDFHILCPADIIGNCSGLL